MARHNNSVAGYFLGFNDFPHSDAHEIMFRRTLIKIIAPSLESTSSISLTLFFHGFPHFLQLQRIHCERAFLDTALHFLNECFSRNRRHNKLNITVYDAAFLSLAGKLDLRFLTLDSKLVEKLECTRYAGLIGCP